MTNYYIAYPGSHTWFCKTQTQWIADDYRNRGYTVITEKTADKRQKDIDFIHRRAMAMTRLIGCDKNCQRLAARSTGHPL